MFFLGFILCLSVVSIAQESIDTLTVIAPEDSLQDSSLALPPPPPPVDWKGRLLVIPLESDLDSTQQVLWNQLVFQVLKEQSGAPPLMVTISDFTGCQNVDCLIQQARARGAQGLFTGRVRTLQDSLDLRFRIQWVQGKKAAVSDVRERIPNQFSKIFHEGTFPRLIAEVTGAERPKPKDRRSWVHVETEPDGAVLMVNGRESICKTPCTFVRTDSGTIDLSAYWRVEANLWAARSSLRLIPGDTSKIHLKLQRSSTLAEIRSEPSGAEVLPPGPLDPKVRAWGKTPHLIYDRDPGVTQVRLWYPGYHDTLVTLHIDPFDKTVVSPVLSPITNPSELLAQKSMLRERRQRKIGFTLLGVSITPFLIGGTLLYLAQADYQDARDIKNDLEQTPAVGGSGFEDKIKQNAKAADRGDKKFYTGIGLTGLGLLLASTGFVMVF